LTTTGGTQPFANRWHGTFAYVYKGIYIRKGIFGIWVLSWKTFKIQWTCW